MSLVIPPTIDEFCRECSGLLYYNAKRWYRPYLASSHDDYCQAAMTALIREWDSCPADADERRAWVWKVISRASQRLHRRDIRNARRLHELGEGSLEQLIAGDQPDAADWCGQKERIGQVQDALGRLPHRLRIVVDRLYGLDGLPAAGTYYQTGLDVGLNRDAVADRVQQAHDLLREALYEDAV